MSRELTADEAEAMGWDVGLRDNDGKPRTMDDVFARPGYGLVNVAGCHGCHAPGLLPANQWGPGHWASPRCESGMKAHCSCDVCF